MVALSALLGAVIAAPGARAAKMPDRVRDLAARYEAWAKRSNVALWPVDPQAKPIPQKPFAEYRGQR
jgi:hypothetical protein